MFEEDVILYLSNLCLNNTFFSGDIVGVNNALEIAEAKVTILKNNELFETKILILRKDSIFSWKFFNTIDNISENFKNWEENVDYIAGEKVSYGGKLYLVIQNHTSQSTWTPDVSSALFSLKTISGVASVWVQPLGSFDSYLMGQQVNHNGFVWSSTISYNIWEPGAVGAESLWVKVPNVGPIVTDYPDWVQPTGSQDAYNMGDKVKFEGNVWESLIDNNVWSPTAYPAAWKML